MINSAKRLETIPTSIFSIMSQKAFEYGATNLGQGFPDFDGPTWIMESAFEAMKSGKNQYAPSSGILSLKKSIQNNFKQLYSIDYEADSEITITAGATEALFSSIQAFIESGDEVIMFEPVYDSHQADVILAGGKPVYVTLNKPDFKFDFEELESAITPKTKMIIVNNPHNPTGKVYSKEELQVIASLAIKHNLLVISDEVYEHITFDNIPHIPIATIDGMKDRTITISSTGKTFSMTGWKIGWAASSKELTKYIRGIHEWTTFAVNTPGQHAMAYALSQLDDYLPDFKKMYQNKKDLVINELNGSLFKTHLCSGSYFIMIDIPENSKINDVDMALTLVEKYKVATIPTSVFYGKSQEGQSMLRLCFAKRNETIIEGINKLKSYK